MNYKKRLERLEQSQGQSNWQQNVVAWRRGNNFEPIEVIEARRQEAMETLAKYEADGGTNEQL